MHTPTTTMREPRGARRHDLIEHAGHADALEDHRGTQRRARHPRRLLRRRASDRPHRGGLAPALPRHRLRGIDDDVAPTATASSRRRFEKSAATIGRAPARRSAAITAEADRTAADDERRVVGLQPCPWRRRARRRPSAR
jgi:hypothetical protein